MKLMTDQIRSTMTDLHVLARSKDLIRPYKQRSASVLDLFETCNMTKLELSVLTMPDIYTCTQI